MDLHVKLKDEDLCDGCPFENREKTCCGGFVREVARIKAVAGRQYGWIEEQSGVVFSAIRPQSCLLANERAEKVIGKLAVKEEAEDKGSQGSVLHFPQFTQEYPPELGGKIELFTMEDLAKAINKLKRGDIRP